jgi:hypothetical protein
MARKNDLKAVIDIDTTQLNEAIAKVQKLLDMLCEVQRLLDALYEAKKLLCEVDSPTPGILRDGDVNENEKM